MADDQYTPVVDANVAMRAVAAAVEIRRGYKKLIEQMIEPFPLKFQYDQSKRNQMITLLGRAETLWVLLLVHSESAFVSRSRRVKLQQQREELLGPYLTRAAIAKGLAISEQGSADAIAQQRHTVAASRLVEAGIAYGLFELSEQPDAKQQPIAGTQRLASFLHALGDHAHWSMRDALRAEPDPSHGTGLNGLREEAGRFDRENSNERILAQSRVTATDLLMAMIL